MSLAQWIVSVVGTVILLGMLAGLVAIFSAAGAVLSGILFAIGCVWALYKGVSLFVAYLFHGRKKQE